MSNPDKNESQKYDPSRHRENSDPDLSSTAFSKIERSPSLYTLGNELHEYMERESMGYQVYPGAERVDYDFTAERLNMYTTNLIESTAHLIKGCLGAGILSMHVGYMYGGLWTSMASTFVIGFFVSYCMLMLVTSAQKMYVKMRIPKLTYADLAEVAVATGPWVRIRRFSKPFRYIVDSSLFISMCGTCCIYEIMIAITMKQALEAVSPTMQDTDLSIRYYILMISAPLMMVCLVRELKYLAPFSLVADMFIVICVFTTMYFSIVEAGSIDSRASWRSMHGLLRFSGMCLFSVDGIRVTLTVENNMRKPKYFSIVLQYGMAIVLICVAVTGFLGYWGWGEKSEGPITIHMPPETIPILIMQFVMAIMLSVTFAVHLWVPFRIAWHYIIRRHKRKRDIWERFYRIIHVFLITGLSVALPNMIKLMIFMGNFFSALNAFIFPAFIDNLITWKEHRKGIRWRLIKNGILMLFGVVVSTAAFYSLIDI